MKKRGISLITLVVTIIVIIILAAAVILTINNNNPLSNASKATLQSDLKSFQESLQLYIGQKTIENTGTFQSNSLRANETILSYNTKPIEETGNIYTILPEAKGRYTGKLEIINGELTFSSKVEQELIWAKEVGIAVNVFTVVDGELQSSNSSLLLMDGNGKVVIPGNVTKIASGVFNNVAGLKTVVIPGTVKEIGMNAFSNNTTLETVIMEEGVEIIGHSAFISCSNLKKLQIPNSVKTIGESAFAACASLTNFTFPKSLTEIPIQLLSYCSGLTNITIPEGITKINANAFSNCQNLKKVSIPSTVTSISNNIFTACKQLTDVTVNAANQTYTFIDGALYTKALDSVVFVLPNTTEITLPNTLKNILNGVFAGCDNITTITIPSSVTSIEMGAFDNMKSLQMVTVESGNTLYSNDGAFLYNKDQTILYRCFSNDASITVKNGVKTIGSLAFYNRNQLTELIFPDSLTTIGHYAFDSAYRLINLSIGKNVTNLDVKFLVNSGIQNISIDPQNSNYSYENQILFNKDKTVLITVLRTAEKVVVPNTVTELLGGSLYYCGNVKEIIIPSSVKKLGNNVFEGCSGLTSIEIPSSVEILGSGCFKSTKNLSQIIIQKPKDSITGSPWESPYGERAIIWKAS